MLCCRIVVIASHRELLNAYIQDIWINSSVSVGWSWSGSGGPGSCWANTMERFPDPLLSGKETTIKGASVPSFLSCLLEGKMEENK
jgi:hypothetical protein